MSLNTDDQSRSDAQTTMAWGAPAQAGRAAGRARSERPRRVRLRQDGAQGPRAKGAANATRASVPMTQRAAFGQAAPYGQPSALGQQAPAGAPGASQPDSGEDAHPVSISLVVGSVLSAVTSLLLLSLIHI